YDGTTTVSVTPVGTVSLRSAEAPGSGSTADLTPYTGDAVSLTGTVTGTFNSKDVATANLITIGGMSLAGAQSGNYSLSNPTSQSAVQITPKPLTYSGLSVPGSRLYDHTTTAGPVSGSSALPAAEGPAFGTGGDGKPYTGDTVSLTSTPTATYN